MPLYPNVGPILLEKDIAEKLRRMRKSPRGGAIRRDLLRHFVEFARSDDASLKKFAAAHFCELFAEFPDMEDDVINSIYDLCEDGEAQVRLKGYEVINEISGLQPKLVKRNADVLVQLLQNEDQNEVVIVKRALTRHMDIDLEATWSVFCDSVQVPIEDPMDEEECESRKRICTLVLAYLAESRSQISRHVANREGENVIVDGLLKCLTRAESNHVRPIIYDVLFPLPCYSFHSERGAHLLQVILERLHGCLELYAPPIDISELDEKVDSDTMIFLDLANDVAIRRRMAHPHFLARFLFGDFVRAILPHVPRKLQISLSSQATEALRAEHEIRGAKAPGYDLPYIELLVTPHDLAAGYKAIFEILVTDADMDEDALQIVQSCLSVLSERFESAAGMPTGLKGTLLDLQRRMQASMDLDNFSENCTKVAVVRLIRTIFSPPSKNIDLSQEFANAKTQNGQIKIRRKRASQGYVRPLADPSTPVEGERLQMTRAQLPALQTNLSWRSMQSKSTSPVSSAEGRKRKIGMCEAVPTSSRSTAASSSPSPGGLSIVGAALLAQPITDDYSFGDVVPHANERFIKRTRRDGDETGHTSPKRMRLLARLTLSPSDFIVPQEPANWYTRDQVEPLFRPRPPQPERPSPSEEFSIKGAAVRDEFAVGEFNGYFGRGQPRRSRLLEILSD